jgi:hypothetical protein
MITLDMEETEELETALAEHSHDFENEWNENIQERMESSWLHKNKGSYAAYDVHGNLRGA